MQECLFMKLIIVGDSGVGKTSILNRFFSGFFESTTIPTIGYDFTTKLYSKPNTQLCKLQIWDIAGQDRYQAVSKLYARNADGCLVVCDISNYESLEHTLKWKTIVQEQCTYLHEIPFVLVQNKTDLILESSYEFMKEEFLKEFAEKNKFSAAFQSSAKQNIGINEAFDALVEKAVEVAVKNQHFIEEGKNSEIIQRISTKYGKVGENGKKSKGTPEKRKGCCILN